MQTRYNDFIPKRVTNITLVITAAFLVLQYVNDLLLKNSILAGLFMALFMIMFIVTLFLYFVNRKFDYTRGKMLIPVQRAMMKRLSFNGKGKILDYGCGLGAYTVNLAQGYKHAYVDGVDNFQNDTDFNDAQINLKLEKVKKRTAIRDIKLNSLDYQSNSLEAVTSCFGLSRSKVYKKGLDEALRTLKKGGTFCFCDYFDNPQLYDINAIIAELKKQGFNNVQYKAAMEKEDYVPKYVRLPHVYRQVGMLYGKK